jgi:outer membrane protein TolC
MGVPLWFMLDHRGRIAEAAANCSSAESDLRMVRNELYARTQAAFTELKHEETQVKLYISDVLPQAEEVFRVASKSFDAGEITYVEFLQARQTLVSARGNYADALLLYNLAMVTIEETVGKTIKGSSKYS